MSRPPSSSSSASVDRRRLWRDWEVLCRDIGERRAGTPEERRAAAFVARRLAASELDAVEVLDFP
jgi:hypothetical protein